MSPLPSPRSSGSLPIAVPRDSTDVVTLADALIADVAVLRRQIDHLLEDRARRSRVDHALGILMHRYGMDGLTASETLERWSHVVDLPVEDLAEVLVTLTVDDDAAPPLPRDVAHTVSRLLRRELVSTSDRSLGTRSVARRP